MSEYNHNVYLAWKPLRNRLVKYDLYDSLAVIRWYFARQQSSLDLPVPSDLRPHKDIDDFRYFTPFELETLSREVLISSRTQSSPQYTMRNPDHLAKAINLLKHVDDVVSSQYITQDNVLYELEVRLAHRQFKYQTERPNTTSLLRYSKIFSYPKVEQYVIAKTGLTTKQIFTIGSAFWVSFLRNFRLSIGIVNSSIPGITKEHAEKFISYFGKPLEEVRSKLVSTDEHPMNDMFQYAYNSQTAHPLMRITYENEESLICPLPTLLVWRFTSGLYYDLYDLKIDGVDFGSVFGLAYEQYIGDVLKSTFASSSTNVYSGEPITGTNPNTCDWVIESSNDVLLVEAKTKRMSMIAKTTLTSKADLEKQLEILSEAVVQVYRSFLAYKNDTYVNPVYRFSSEKKHYVSVVTLEPWYLMGKQVTDLKKLVATKLQTLTIDASIIEEVPYVIMSSNDFESFSYLRKSKSLDSIIQPYIDGQRDRFMGHEFGNYITHNFKDELKGYEYVFEDELNNVFTIPLKNAQKNTDD